MATDRHALPSIQLRRGCHASCPVPLPTAPPPPAGYREACDCARAVLESGSFNHSADADKFRTDLLNIAKTTLSSKILTVVRGLCWAVGQIKGS